jgi:hypothetical protein
MFANSLITEFDTSSDALEIFSAIFVLMSVVFILIYVLVFIFLILTCAYTPNTLSFKYSRTSGEIVLCPEVFMKQDYNIGNKFESKVVYLFIHSCVHLLDLDHGPKMDKLEKKFIKAFVV